LQGDEIEAQTGHLVFYSFFSLPLAG
jgi:hypothetical protein